MTEKTIDKKIMTYGSVTLILTFIAVVLRTVCFFVSYDAYIGYFKEGFLTSVMNAFLVVSAFYFVSARFTVKDSVLCSDGRGNNVPLRIASLIFAMALAYSFGNVIFQPAAGNWYIMALAIVSILAASYFLVRFLDAKNNTLYALLGLSVALYCVIVVIITYFDVYELLNGPNKIMLQLALLSTALFMLAEIRAHADELKKGFYVATLCAATFFSGACSLPTLIFFSSKNNFTNSYYVFHVVIAGAFIYLLVRLITFVLTPASPVVNEEKNEETNEEANENADPAETSSEVAGE